MECHARQQSFVAFDVGAILYLVVTLGCFVHFLFQFLLFRALGVFANIALAQLAKAAEAGNRTLQVTDEGTVTIQMPPNSAVVLVFECLPARNRN